MVRQVRRQQNHFRWEERLAEAVAPLAEMNGFAAGSQLQEGEGPFVSGSFNRLKERVDAFGGPSPSLTAADGISGEHAYFRELFGAHGDYSGESTTVVPLSISLLALPSGCEEPAPVFVGAEGRAADV